MNIFSKPLELYFYWAATCVAQYPNNSRTRTCINHDYPNWQGCVSFSNMVDSLRVGRSALLTLYRQIGLSSQNLRNYKNFFALGS